MKKCTLLTALLAKFLCTIFRLCISMARFLIFIVIFIDLPTIGEAIFNNLSRFASFLMVLVSLLHGDTEQHTYIARFNY